MEKGLSARLLHKPLLHLRETICLAAPSVSSLVCNRRCHRTDTLSPLLFSSPFLSSSLHFREGQGSLRRTQLQVLHRGFAFAALSLIILMMDAPLGHDESWKQKGLTFVRGSRRTFRFTTVNNAATSREVICGLSPRQPFHLKVNDVLDRTE